MGEMVNTIETAVLDMFATRYVTLAAITLLFYDHLITLKDEVALIWRAKFGVVKAIFLFNRYIVSIWIAASFTMLSGLASSLTPLTQVCRYWLVTNVYLEVIALQTTSFIVATRVLDIWQNQRLAYFILCPLWVIHFALDLLICTQNFIHRFSSFAYDPISNTCHANIKDSWTVWLNGIIYHACILSILIYLWLSTPRTSKTPLMNVVVRDGFIYFITIFSAMLFNLLIWRYARSSLAGLPYTSVWVVTTLSLSRMLLSMGSVQAPEEWGQRAKLTFPARDIELGHRRPAKGRVEFVKRENAVSNSWTESTGSVTHSAMGWYKS